MQAAIAYEARTGVARLALGRRTETLGPAGRARIAAALAQAIDDPAVDVLLFVSDGGGLPAAAEFAVESGDDAPDAPDLDTLADMIEACPKPVVAVLAGEVEASTLGLVLAAHYRVAAASARLSFPEARLGLVPGGGATVRATRLAGAGTALAMMVSGRRLTGRGARSAGLVDAVTAADPDAIALALARTLAAEGVGPRPSAAAMRGAQTADAGLDALASARGASTGVALRIVDAIEAAVLLPVPEALAYAADARAETEGAPEAQALVRLARAERSVRAPEWLAGTARREVARIGIVGAGRRGTGLAIAAMARGFDVTLVETSEAALERAVLAIIEHFDAAAEAGRTGGLESDDIIERLTGVYRLDALAESDVVFELTSEASENRPALLAALDRVMQLGAVLVTGADPAAVDRLASATERPGEVIAAAFPSSEARRRVVEFAPGVETGKEAAATLWWLLRRLGKLPVEARGGAICKALRGALGTAADRLLAHGGGPAEIDAAARAIGLPEGPFEAQDRAGLEGRRDAPGALPLVATLCEAGRTGRAAGAGIHDWPGDGGPPVASAEVARRLAELRRAAGMPPRSFSREDLEGALLSALAKAGAALLADGIAVRPADIDLVAVHGLGMARVTGGPMTAADLRGLDALRDRLKSLERLDRDIWGREPLIDRLAAAGEGFADFRR